MRWKRLLVSLLPKLVMLVILLVLFVGAVSAPISRAASCDDVFKVCPTGSGTHAVTEDDVIQYLTSQPALSNHTKLLRLVIIDEFKYLPLSETDYFQGMSGNGLPSGDTPALSVKIHGILFAFSRGQTNTFYGHVTLLFNAQTGDMFETETGPM